MATDRNKLNEMEQRAASAFGQQDRETLFELLDGNLEEGDYLVYSRTYSQPLIVREEEMPLIIAYQGELHVSDNDDMQDAWEILNAIHRNAVNGDFTVSYNTFMKIAKLVDPKGEVDTGKPLDGELDENNLPVDPLATGPTDTDWMTDDNIRKLKD